MSGRLIQQLWFKTPQVYGVGDFCQALFLLSSGVVVKHPGMDGSRGIIRYPDGDPAILTVSRCVIGNGDPGRGVDDYHDLIIF